MRLIPKGWHKYQPMGDCVAGTRFIAFKVPLKLFQTDTMSRVWASMGVLMVEEVCTSRLQNEEDWLTPTTLLQKQPQLKTIIDLTDTTRYYDPQEFREQGVAHIKINVAGGGRLPQPLKMQQFFEAVDEFIEKHVDDPDALIGVHCTHGLNRTGYFICNYMVNRMKMTAEDAIARFESARGHTMERQVLIKGIQVSSKEDKEESTSIYRNYEQYRSPLEDNYEDSRASLRDREPLSWRTHNPRNSSPYHEDRYRNRPLRVEEPYNNPRNYSYKTRNRNRGRSGNGERISASSSGNWRESP